MGCGPVPAKNETLITVSVHYCLCYRIYLKPDGPSVFAHLIQHTLFEMIDARISMNALSLRCQ